MDITIIGAIIIGVLVWELIGFIVWGFGVKDKSVIWTILGGLFTLGFLGLVISAIIIFSGNDSTQNNFSKEHLELERQKFEFEKQKGFGNNKKNNS